MAKLELRLSAGSPSEIARGLIDACRPPPFLHAWLGKRRSPLLAADQILLDAREAYVHGRYQEAIEIAELSIDPATIVEEWLQGAGLPAGRAHALAKGVAPAPGRPDLLRQIRMHMTPRAPTPSPDPNDG